MKTTRKAKSPIAPALVNSPAIIAMLDKLKSPEFGWMPYEELPEGLRTQFESAARHLTAGEVAQLAELVSKSGAAKGLSAAALVGHWNDAWRSASGVLGQARARRSREREASASEPAASLGSRGQSEMHMGEGSPEASIAGMTSAAVTDDTSHAAASMHPSAIRDEQSDETRLRYIQKKAAEVAAARSQG